MSTPFNQGFAVAATVATAEKLNRECNTPLSFSEQFKLLDDRTIKVDTDGDLSLVVTCGDQSKTFRVCSQQMRSASPVWYILLDPNSEFATVRDGNLYLNDDNLEAVLIILLACHHKYQRVPQSIGLDTLMAICVVADKYDCINELRSWIHNWVDKVYSSSVLYGPQWPFIAWVVGDMEKFKAVTAHLISVCATNDSGQCLSRSGDVLDELLLPDLPSCILQTRASIITALVEACHSLMKKYKNDDKMMLCRGGKRPSDCNDLVTGSLERKLKAIKLWPGEPQEILRNLQSRSLDQLFKDVKGIKSSIDLDGSTGRLNNHHTLCGYDSAIDRILDDANSRAKRGTAILDSHRRHMETQRGKLQPTEPSLGSLQN